jgi:hypothetical protein
MADMQAPDTGPYTPAKTLEDDDIFASIENDRSGEGLRLATRDDNTTIVRRHFQMAQAAMHVVPLDPYWRVSGDLGN